MSRGSNTHEQYVTRCPVSHLVHSPGRMASVITRKISTRDPGITILGSQQTRLARLSKNCTPINRRPNIRFHSLSLLVILAIALQVSILPGAKSAAYFF